MRQGLIASILIAVVLIAGRAGAETPASPRLEGRVPDKAPLVSIDQTRGTVLDALTEISRQAGWTLVVSAPESAGARTLAIQVKKRPATEALNLVLEAGALRATFADNVLRVRPDTVAADAPRERRGRRGRHAERGDRVVVGNSL